MIGTVMSTRTGVAAMRVVILTRIISPNMAPDRAIPAGAIDQPTP